MVPLGALPSSLSSVTVLPDTAVTLAPSGMLVPVAVMPTTTLPLRPDSVTVEYCTAVAVLTVASLPLGRLALPSRVASG